MDSCTDHGHRKCLNRGGYYRAWDARTKKLELLHRVVYCESNGVSLFSIAGLSVRHTCDNPRCINPEHLILGTHADNMRDRAERGRCANVVGEQNPKAALNWDAVASIRAEYVRNKKGLRAALAIKYGVSPATISDVVSYRSWNNA